MSAQDDYRFLAQPNSLMLLLLCHGELVVGGPCKLWMPPDGLTVVRQRSRGVVLSVKVGSGVLSFAAFLSEHSVSVEDEVVVNAMSGLTAGRQRLMVKGGVGG
eukprot:1228714-Amphidinium_carterae.1